MSHIVQEFAQQGLHDQLFRYAQDLQTLIEQHGKLQQRYQECLETQGQTIFTNDLLQGSIRYDHTPYLTTDSSGVITQVSASVEPLLGESSLALCGCPLMQLVPLDQRQAFGELLALLGDSDANAAIIQCRLHLFDGQELGSISAFDVLIVPLKTFGNVDYFWLLNTSSANALDPIAALEQFQLLHDSANGLLITDASNLVRIVNQAYSEITGYTAADAIGHHPHMHAAGRHDQNFYEKFLATLSASGSWSGEFFNRRSNGQIYPEWRTIKQVKNLQGDTLAHVTVFVDSSQQHSDSDHLTHMAYHDALTGLPNRRLLEDRLTHALSQAQRDGPGLSLLFIDLDRFKPINDKLGHEIGDLVLQEIAKRLKKSVRQGDTVARVGGDEFVILLKKAVRSGNVQNIADTILSILSEPITVGDHKLLVGASIGCARYPQDGSDSANLLKHADAAMYAAKRHGGNHFCFHETKDSPDALANLGRDLWQALTHDELHLVYQPQVRSDGRLHGCEALVRWTHPTLGEITPTVFIPIAETNGAILPLGDWVLETACKQLRKWDLAGWPNLTMAVNVSARQLADPGFAQRVCQILLSTGVAPRSLELEITESEALRRSDGGHQVLQYLRDQGIRIAIDDFGTGYSSLSRLQSLAVDRLKIDQQFVRDIATSMSARAISQCFVSMGLAMGLEVVAEGVETHEQLQVLNAQGCQLIQGYFTGRPMTAESLQAWCELNTHLLSRT